MIKINLLPVREWRRREAVRQQISIFILIFILLLTGLLAAGMVTQGKLRSQKRELAALEARKAKLAYVNKKIKVLNAKRKEVENKFVAIEKLQEGRTYTVKVMDEIVSLLPIDRIWLTNLKFRKNRLEMEGVALDNHTVALFMQRMDASPMFGRVTLKNTMQKGIQGHDLMKFGISVAMQESQNIKAGKSTSNKSGKSKKT
ncbi:MAG TPA: hypothetical protein EYP57_07755 [Thermodesulfobacteriaceae bacterium]|nr:hypothetical protein [Thermodesulfobacteriaceae bacterium]